MLLRFAFGEAQLILIIMEFFGKVLFLLIALQFLLSCRSDVGPSSIKSDVTVSFEADIFLSVVDTIVVAAEDTYKLGGDFGELFYDKKERSVLLTELSSGVISKINQGGGIVWRLKTPTSPPVAIKDVGNIDKNPVTNNFYVYDRIQKKIFVVDKTGGINRSFLVEPDFIDFGILKNGDIVYFTEGFYNTHVTGEEKAFKFMVYENDTNLKSRLYPVPLPTSNIVFNDYDDFYRVENELYFNKQFADTVFQIKELEISAAYIAREKNGNSQELLDDPTVQDPYRIIYEDDIPSVLKSVQAGKFNYQRVGVNGRESFVVKSETKELFRSKILLVDGKYLTVPKFYNDGYFFSVMPKRQYDSFQSGVVSDRTLLLGNDLFSDKDGMVITVLKIPL